MTREEMAAAIEDFAKAYQTHQRDGYTAGMTAARTRLSLFVLEHADEIAAALRAPSPEPTAEEVERAAEVIAEVHQCDWGTAAVCTAERCMCKLCAAAALRAARSRP